VRCDELDVMLICSMSVSVIHVEKLRPAPLTR